MSANIHEIYVANPITTNASTDLMYFGQSPYGNGDDAAMLFSDFQAQFAGSGVTSAQVQAATFNTINPNLDSPDVYSAAATPSLTAGYPNTIWITNFTFGNSTPAPTLNIDSIGAIPITYDKGPLQPHDLGFTDGVQLLLFDGSSFELLNPRVSGSTTATQKSVYNYGTDTGAANAYAVDLSPAVTSYTDGLEVAFTPAHNSTTTTPTLALNGLSAITIALSHGAVASGALSTGMIAKCIYSSAANKFILLTSAV